LLSGPYAKISRKNRTYIPYRHFSRHLTVCGHGTEIRKAAVPGETAAATQKQEITQQDAQNIPFVNAFLPCSTG
jgi:hypothetical protein